MKKIHAIIVCCLLAFSGINAQVKFNPGVRAGLNFATINDTDLGYKTDFYLGAFGALEFNEFYTLQPEMNYSRQGGKGTVMARKDGIPNDPRKADISIQYLSVGAVGKFTFAKRFFALAGPYVEFIVGHDFEVDGPRELATKASDIDFGLTGGAGAELFKGFSLEGRVKMGTYDSFDDYQGRVNINTNLVFSLGASYKLDLKK